MHPENTGGSVGLPNWGQGLGRDYFSSFHSFTEYQGN